MSMATVIRRTLSVNLALLHSFFFQAEDGIRDKLVTGVQTCALPICRRHALDHFDLAEVHRRNLQQADRSGLTAVERQAVRQDLRVASAQPLDAHVRRARSEERRVGKEWRARWWADRWCNRSTVRDGG